MQHGGRAAIAVSLAARSFTSSSSAAAADELGSFLLVASICKAFSAPAGPPAALCSSRPPQTSPTQLCSRSSAAPRCNRRPRLSSCDGLPLSPTTPPPPPPSPSSSARTAARASWTTSGRSSASPSRPPPAPRRSGGARRWRRLLPPPRIYNSIVLALICKSQLGLALSMFWKLLETSSELERLACNELLVALRRAEMRDDFVKVFDALAQKGFRFDTCGFNICIHAFGCWGRLDFSLKLFKEMKEKGLPEAAADICTYNSLIHALCSAGKVDDALAVYEELKGSGHEPDRFTYRALIHGCCKVYRVDDAVRIFRELEYNNLRADTLLYNSLLSGLLKGRKLADACQLFERMVSEGVRASCYTYNILIDGLFRNGRSAAGFALFCDLKKKGQFVDAVTYSTVAMQLCREGQVDGALELVEEMEARGFTVDLLTVSALLVGLHQCGRWDWAERLMKHVRDSNLVPSVLRWTTAMEASMRQHQSRRADHTPLFPAAGDLTDVLGWPKPPPEAEKDTQGTRSGDDCNEEWSSSPTMDKLASRTEAMEGFSSFTVRRGRRVHQRGGAKAFDIDMVNTYLSIFLAEGKLSVACKLFEIFTELGRAPVSYTYNSLMSSFIKKGYFDAAWGLLQEMGGKLCPADIATYNLILQGLGRMGRADLASAVLDQLKKKGGFLDVVMYNTLIHALGKAGRMEEVNQLLKKMAREGINPDVVTFNTLIEVHAKAGRVRDAYRFLRMMLDAGCSPNHVTDTILDFLEKEIERTRFQRASMKLGKNGDD
ncbi:unnamed protein product [Spirodela intermedia]|uniref:Uncharacterized protein n=1 Tax=Spirodela intermedia TaxID=51605 RepID=A0A7I8JW58_SPIIN|nr:unnamed protein product [Spirodela intermedia]CAA6673702.1 unnamed protein product [Spirodela intermedia]